MLQSNWLEHLTHSRAAEQSGKRRPSQPHRRRLVSASGKPEIFAASNGVSDYSATRTCVLGVSDEDHCERLFNSEVNLDVSPNRHRFVLQANDGLELPVSYGLDCVFVQAVTQRTFDLAYLLYKRRLRTLGLGQAYPRTCTRANSTVSETLLPLTSVCPGHQNCPLELLGRSPRQSSHRC